MNRNIAPAFISLNYFGCKMMIGCIIIFMLGAFKNGTTIFDITDYGAKADDSTINTKAINKTIQVCHDHGGGTVLIPPGKFVSGTIILLSNVTISLENGAVLIGSKDTSDYLLQKNTLFNEGYNRYGLIYAENATNIAITGFGQINGRGTYFMNGLDKPHIGNDFDRKFIRQGENFMKTGTIFEDGPVFYPFRPGLLITILYCDHVHIKDVSLKDAPEWTMRLGDCDNIDITGITIQNNPLIPNNDGIHCTTSRNITISDCKIFTGDDAIIVTGFSNGTSADKSDGDLTIYGNKTGIAENVTVTNCVLSSRSACIRVGYGEHPIRNLVFSNITMFASNRGIGIFARNKSSIEKVLFSNIIINTQLYTGHWWGKGEPIHISAVRDGKDGSAGSIKNITFSNITANSETGIVIIGTPKSIIEDISFTGLKLTIVKGKNSEAYGGNFDLRPAYPVDSAIFKHDIPAIYARYVRGISFDDVQVIWKKDPASFFTNGIEADHYDDLSIQSSSITPASNDKNKYAIKLSNGTNTNIFNCRTTRGFQFIQKNNVE